ncbi:MAG TPA: type II toxin-antitoxin system death-on-curing family toxin [Alloacidobacterium sp.]|nr:type II toxin-antitoxin system death-on-curing family toxin [Alloacidobacterium sp.]
MSGFRTLNAAGVIAIHEELIARYGGTQGLRDRNLLESALARPLHLATYQHDVTIPDLAASYSWGLLRNHPFVDGNKRIALASIVVFLALNGWELICSEAEETAMILRAAAGEIDETYWSQWLKQVSRKKRA